MIAGAVTTILIVVVSASFHEAAHAWVADRCGDPTARRLGRVTLNPLKHIDPVWSILVPLLLYVGSNGNFMFGMAKPVPVEPRNYRSRRRDDILVSAAGPAANLLLALAAALLFIPFGRLAAPETTNAYVLVHVILVNLSLAAFNFLPIPPLDGSHVLEMIAPPGLAKLIRKVRPYGMFILMAVMVTGADKRYMEITVYNGIYALCRLSPPLIPALLAVAGRN